MRQLVSNLYNDKTIFIGDFDSYTIIRHKTSYDYHDGFEYHKNTHTVI